MNRTVAWGMLLGGALWAAALAAEGLPLDITTFTYTETRYEYRNNRTGPFECDLEITRYYGTKEERARQMQLGLLPKKVDLCITHKDCDSEDTDDYPTEPISPEVDPVTLNGHSLGKLRGLNNRWATTRFEVPLEYLKFPTAPGQVARNRVVIKVDVANQNNWWDLVLGTISVTIPAPRPIFLVHGWTDSLASVHGMAAAIRRRFGIPTYIADVSYANSPEANARMLQRQLEQQTEKYGVSSFQIVAHSKGGLDSRALMDPAGLGSPLVSHLVQVATPNGGSHLADALDNAEGGREHILKGGAWVMNGYEKEDNPGRRSLRVGSCAAFNRRYASRANISTVIGYVRNVGFNYGDGLTDRLAQSAQAHGAEISYGHDTAHKVPDGELPDSRKGDLVVSVASAHCLGTQVAASPLRNDSDLRYSHGEIMVKGADGVLDVFEGLLTGKGASRRGGGKAAPRSLRSAPEYAELGGIGEGASAMSTGVVEVQAEGGSGTEQFTVRAGNAPLSVRVAGLQAGATAELVAPNGTRTPVERLDQMAGLEYLEGMAVAELEDAPRGRYTLEVKGGRAGLVTFEVQGAGVSTLALVAESEPQSEDRLDYLVKTRMELDGEVVRAPLAAPAIVRRIDLPREAAWPTLPLELRDDGEGGDECAGDGIYSGLVHLGEPGVYEALVALQGEIDGLPDVRTAEVRLAALPAAEILDGCAAETPDENGNGLSDRLLVRVAAETTVPGEYVLHGQLVSADGRELASSSGCASVSSAGRAEFVLPFDGRQLAAAEADGEWRLAGLELCWVASGRRECAVPLAVREAEMAVGEFRSVDFERTPLLQLRGCVADWHEAPELCNGYVVDHLCVLAEVEAPPLLAGKCTFQARLCDANGQFICMSEGVEVELGAREGESAFPVCFRFEGWHILRHRSNGPYLVAQILVDQEGGGGATASFEAGYETSAYSVGDFGPKRKLLVLGNIYDGVEIGTPSAPDAGGWRTVEVAFARPTEAQAEELKMFGLAHWEEFCCWKLRAEAFIGATRADCELEHGVEWAWGGGIATAVDCTAAVQAQGAGSWAPGQKMRFQVRFRMNLPDGGLPPLVLCIFFDREEAAPAVSSVEGIFHELDTDQDGSIVDSEVADGWERWKRDECMSQVFLEAVTLGKYAAYRYDDADGRFRPAP